MFVATLLFTWLVGLLSAAVLGGGLYMGLNGRWIVLMFHDATSVLSTIRVPILVFTSDLDRMTVPERVGFMAAAVLGARVARLAPAGHMPVFERQKELVSDFAKRADEVLPKAGRPLVASSSRK